jgi:periplasmic divalent cation tolerance protein
LPQWRLINPAGSPQMMPSEQPVVLSVTTTVPAREQGLALARVVLESRLAACAQVDEAGITSLYRWQGQLCEEHEFRVVFKTLPVCEARLQALVAAQHPYEVPQWVATQAMASDAYWRWVRAEVDT